jgi:hypothetical protein
MAGVKEVSAGTAPSFFIPARKLKGPFCCRHEEKRGVLSLPQACQGSFTSCPGHGRAAVAAMSDSGGRVPFHYHHLLIKVKDTKIQSMKANST